MADPGTFASAKLNATAAKKALAQIDKDFERATMYGLRAAGREAKQTAKRGAPRLKGDLRDSIHSSRRLKKLGPGSYKINVGPWGPKVNLYRAKANARKPYMEPAFQEIHGRMADKFIAAYTRVLEKKGRV